MGQQFFFVEQAVTHLNEDQRNWKHVHFWPSVARRIGLHLLGGPQRDQELRQ
jgi:hypothetical protein